MSDLPPDSVLYTALLTRDPRYDGRAFVGVTTTGIFCRLTCPARKPLVQNCRWFSTIQESMAAGFRPCLRCHPTLDPGPIIDDLTARLHKEPARRWTERDLVALGYDPSTVRRVFNRQFGQSFLAMARTMRLQQGIARLRMGDAVIEAQLDAGFDSAGGFRHAFARLFGHSPVAMQKRGDLVADWLDTPLGGMIAVADDQALHLLEFVERKALRQGLLRLSAMMGGRIGLGRTPVIDQVQRELEQYFAGSSAEFATPIALHGTEFQNRVWTALRKIRPGETRSYGALAHDLGAPRAVRAVAGANAANRLALIVPCHRVIGADGRLGGYAGGVWRKQKLIALEAGFGAPFCAKRVDATPDWG